MSAFAGNDCECEKNTRIKYDKVCCESLIAECAACKFDLSIEEFCEVNTNFPGCPAYDMSEKHISTDLDMEKIEQKIIETMQDVKAAEKQKNIEVEKQNLLKYKMAKSCGPDYNLNKITTYNKFECRYLGVGELENGKQVRNPFQTWRGTLPSSLTFSKTLIITSTPIVGPRP